MHKPTAIWNGPYHSGYSTPLWMPITISTPQASWRVGFRSAQGLPRQIAHASAPHTSTATGTPSSTARCNGRLCALSRMWQKRAPSYSVM